ncbi:unnamed protein product [Adineta ricciae]|uniref:Uncharacterized protein n=1 Tax=Adineta ricciae TaxID=249248 RepID=A0A815RDD5_ADIRI|nr:unnamed protein product [Adineta ricciae]
MQGIGYYGGASAAPLSTGIMAAAATGVALIIVGTSLGLGLGIGLHSDDQNLTSITTTATNQSVYQGSLSSSSAVYGGVNQSSTNYTYEVIQVVPDTNGSYTFVSTSGSNLQFYGYLYNGSFIPSSPLTNLITRSDSLTGTLQFNLTSTLVENSEYLLVVTTSNQTATGSFNITATGPGLVAFTRRSVAATSATYGAIVINTTNTQLTGNLFVNTNDVVKDVDGVLTFAYISQVTMTFFTAPTVGSGLIYIVVLNRTGSTLIFSPNATYQIPTANITSTASVQTYSIPRNQLPVVSGQYVGVGLSTGGGSLNQLANVPSASLVVSNFGTLAAATYTNNTNGVAFQFVLYTTTAVIG